ncbi:MAG: response regulator [Candidatus Omnitrophica bacterium]|nr:response regulator [Candidatus Omnitrophota bacterium]
MKTHLGRLPEYYSSRDGDSAMVHGATTISLTNRLPQKRGLDQEGMKVMTAKRVLVVDDEVKIRGTYRQILLSMGFDVETASNAVEAQGLLVRSKFDLVLLDINMAEVDGTILFEVMKMFHKDIKVIVSSVYPIDEQKEKIRGAQGYFDKSEGRDSLVSLLASLS